MMACVSQNHHYLPQVYLRQWCNGAHLLRYRRVGSRARLEARWKAPRSIAFEPDLYTVPNGGVANQLQGNELETTLAVACDQRLPRVVAAASQVSGLVANAAVAQDVLWLMKTFVARSPGTVARFAGAVSALLDAHRSTIEKMIERANTPAMRAELGSFLDERRPRTTALAAVAAVVARDLPRDLPWLEGDLYVLSAKECAAYLRAAGAGEFVTFEDPVVEWETGKSDLLASFAASAETLVLLVARGRPWTPGDSLAAALRHALLVPPHRESLLCRTLATGALLAAAERLRPHVQTARARGRRPT